MKKNYKLQNTNYKQITNYKLQITNMGEQNPTAKKSTNEKFLRGELNQSVSGSVGQIDDWQAQPGIPLIMMLRPHPETNENQHKRFAQHIGSPRRGAPGRRRQINE
jgi:hypothetical protein